MSVVHRTSLLWMLLVGPLGSLPAPVSAQCGELTWIEAINQALDANQALVAARQALDAQHKDVAIARSSMLPSLGFIGYGQFSKSTTFSSSAGVVPERNLRLAGEIRETLYDQGDIDTLGAQKHLYESQRYSYENTRNQTIAAAGQDYLGVLLSEALMLLQEENVALSQGSLELTEAQEESGEVPYANVLRLRSQLYSAQQQRVAQKSGVLQSRFRFNQVRNRPAEEVCILEQLSIDKDGFIFSSDTVVEALSEERRASAARDYLVELGLERAPVLRSLDAEIMAEERRMKAGRRWLIPSLDAAAAAAAFIKTSGAGSDETESGELFWQVGLILDWDVLHGGAYIATMNQSKAEFWGLKSQRNNAATSLEENIRGAAAAAMASFERIGLALLQAETAAENYELVNESYLLGESTLLELIDGQDQLVQSNTAASQALYQFLSDLLTLEQSMAYYPFFEEDADARIRELEAKLEGR